MPQKAKVGLGLDFGTESVRAILVDLEGADRGVAVVKYPHGQIVERLPCGRPLRAGFALQHPDDWLKCAAKAVRKAVAESRVAPSDVIGIGVDFTSCTVLPTNVHGTPVCLQGDFDEEPHAWPKLWKHHGAQSQTDRLNAVARARGEALLNRYGGTIGLEWLFPKILEVIEEAPRVAQFAKVWVEAGDWVVWKLVDAGVSDLPRSTCQAGYKGLWSAAEGYPSADYLGAVHADLPGIVRSKLPGRLLPPGHAAGVLCAPEAARFGLPEGIPVSAAIIDAHAAVPGVGAAREGTLVLVLGTSACHMLNAREERPVPGVAGVVKDGILPGFYGYETGQAAVGDAFEWLRRLAGERGFRRLDQEAGKVSPGADGVLCIDWFNGCRTPLMDGSRTASLHGLALRHGVGHVYRALLEGSAFGLKWIVDLLTDSGLPVRRLLATGGLSQNNPLFTQIIADVLGLPVDVHPSGHGSARGAAILGVLAAGRAKSGFGSISAAVSSMGAPPSLAMRRVKPDRANYKRYEPVYRQYRRLAGVGD